MYIYIYIYILIWILWIFCQVLDVGGGLNQFLVEKTAFFEKTPFFVKFWMLGAVSINSWWEKTTFLKNYVPGTYRILQEMFYRIFYIIFPKTRFSEIPCKTN